MSSPMVSGVMCLSQRGSIDNRSTSFNQLDRVGENEFTWKHTAQCNALLHKGTLRHYLCALGLQQQVVKPPPAPETRSRSNSSSEYSSCEALG
mmetsp:Transcript_63273/g.137656  ORF Transcript_63273/g.137656 Transcript_63273/m.137656 type:complete len:93 (-) Transcript_63273:166-444(-)